MNTSLALSELLNRSSGAYATELHKLHKSHFAKI